MTKQTEGNLKTFKNRVWRKICGPFIDKTTGSWRRRSNKELYDILELATVRSFIKIQRTQWLDYIMRRGENKTIRRAFEWKFQGKRLGKRPRERWIDVVEEDLVTLGVENWSEVVQDRDRW